MLLQKLRFLDVEYCNSEVDAQLRVNGRKFREMIEIDEYVYEVEMAKKKVVMDLPVHRGFFILNYAKLRMLRFYHDFLDEFIQRSKFQLVTMDTDSYYFALSTSCMEDAVPLEFYFF